MSRTRKLTFVAGGIALTVLAVAVSYFVIRQGDANADVLAEPRVETSVPVEVIEAIRGSVARTLSTASTLEAEQSAEVLAKVRGVVTEVMAREGAFFKEDQVLAKLDDEEKKLARDKAELTLKKADADLNRAKLSFEQKVISRFKHEEAVFDRDLARSGLETAEFELRYTVVKAPFSGRVTAREIVVGKAIQAGDHLFTLADFGTLIVRLFLPEKDVFELDVGQPVRLVPEAATEDVSFAGRVRDISPVVDPKTGTVKVTVEVLDRSANVRPGAFVRAEIETDLREDTVLVPKIAVVKEGGQEFIFVVVNDRAERRRVELGYTRSGAVEVLNGIAEGEKIIVAGHTALEHGEAVDILTR